MQKIARELNNSETAFIFSSNIDGYDVHLRFFTPQKEVPICGHATIAAHYVRAIENELNTTRVIQRTGAGVLPVDIIRGKDDYQIIMTQGKIEFGKFIVGENREILLSALKLAEEEPGGKLSCSSCINGPLQSHNRYKRQCNFKST